jgi:Flp pilus assembly protein TadD
MSQIVPNSPVPEDQDADVNASLTALSSSLHADIVFLCTESTVQIQPLDDRAVFAQLVEVAQNAARADLVEEFRRRAHGSPAPQNGLVDSAAPAKSLEPDATPWGRPQAGKSLVSEGARLIRENRAPEALETLQEAVRLEPGRHDAHGNLGVALAKLGFVARAEDAFRRSLRLWPSAASMYANVGNACMEQRRFVEAEDAFRKAVRLRPNKADFRRYLGIALQALDRPDEAEAEYRTALALKPGHADCHSRLGKLLVKSGRLTEAEACFREAMRLKE